MESQTEPSVVETPTSPEVPEVDPTPSLDLPEPSETSAADPTPSAEPETPAAGLDEVGAEIAAAGGDPAAAPVETPEPEIEVEAPAAVEMPVWESLDKVDLEAVPEASRPYIEQVKTLAEAAVSKREAELDAVKERFLDTIKQLEDGDTAQAMTGYSELQTSHAALQKDYDDVVIDAFDARNPRYGDLPTAVRSTFAALVNEKKHESMFPDKPRVQQLEKALAFVCFENNVPWPPKAVDGGDDAAAQALVADGTGSTSQPHTPVDKKSYDDILYGPEAAGFLESHFTTRV